MSLYAGSVGSNRCDRRKQLALTRAQFAGVDFGLVETDEDEWWEREHAVRQVTAAPDTSDRQLAAAKCSGLHGSLWECELNL